MDTEYELKKYPRTPHIEGSRLQKGDEDLSQIPFSEILGKNIVIEEKIDGANSAVSFDKNGRLLLQSRGHYLTGGYRERHYDLLKQWAAAHRDSLYAVLGGRYIMYGEWMYAKHSIFYDSLPSYFMEFDIFDREERIFLDTPSRHEMLKGTAVYSVPVLASGIFKASDEILSYLGHSKYIRDGHIGRLREYCVKNGHNADERCAETDGSTTMEGLYIKHEENGQVAARVKYVRASFLQCVAASGTHWIDRPIIPNGLAAPFESLFEEHCNA